MNFFLLCCIFIHLIATSKPTTEGFGVLINSESESARVGRDLKECNPRKNEGCEQFFEDDYPSPLSSDHKCTDFKRKDRGDEHHIQRMLSEDSWLEEKAVGRARQKFYNLFYINGTKPGQEFFWCIIPKTGVTRAKMLIMRMTDLHGHVHPGPTFKSVPYKFAQTLSKEEREKLLFDPNIPRIKLVRNPYIRAISGYVDKIVHNNYKYKNKYVGWHMSFQNIPTFDEWVARLYQNYKQNKAIDEHFATQYERCWENLGFKFDYVLKVERMNYWYSCFVQELNLWQYMMRGWPNKDNCYFSSLDVPCNGPQQTEQGNLIYNASIQGLNHNRDSFELVKEYYKNETTARLVTEMFLEDIVQYNYPFWYEMTWEKYNEIV